MSDILKKELVALLEEKERRNKYFKLDTYFPDTGKYARHLYPKHIEFMERGAEFSERAFIAGNRVGKTLTGCLELTFHTTGRYPEWWKGKRFTAPINAWVASITAQQMKEGVQELLFGNIGDVGSGVIPREDLLSDTGELLTWNMPGQSNCIMTCLVRHHNKEGEFDGHSKIEFKMYEQGWEKFQGTKRQFILLDEEPNSKVYSECLTRTAGDDGEEGLIVCTFTPLLGISDVVLGFMPNGKMPVGGVDPKTPHKFATQVRWDDVPHLSESWKKKTYASYPIHERLARTQGLPFMGAGAIFPIPEEEIMVAPFKIPDHWPRGYGLDVGWNRTAAVWGAQDPDSLQIYLYSEHYRSEVSPPIHASAIKARGDWLIGAIDPAGRQRGQSDGRALLNLYQKEGLDLVDADNALEAGVFKLSNLLFSGQLKVFNTLANWFTEYRLYRRDESGKIIGRNDHLMDATRYFIMTGLDNLQLSPETYEAEYQEHYKIRTGCSDVTGY